MQPYQLNSTDWIKQELAGLLGEQVTRDINDIIRLYSLYDGDGQRWQVETEEKWNEWDAALRWMVQALVKMAGAYGTDSLPTLDFTVSIDHRYPIADDEDAERALDLQEVSQQARSRKCYMRKWHPNEDSDSELAQIVSEQKMLDDGFEDGIRAEMVESKLE